MDHLQSTVPLLYLRTEQCQAFLCVSRWQSGFAHTMCLGSSGLEKSMHVLWKFPFLTFSDLSGSQSNAFSTLENIKVVIESFQQTSSLS